MENSELTKEELQEKRALKREKQRATNLLRASKMHKIRLSDDTALLFKAKPNKKRQYHIGCSGWFYWDWRGDFYPEDLSTKEWFPYYSNTFKTVELNAPFYTWPTVTTVKNWIKQTNGSDFIYTVKVSELITHIKKFVGTSELVKDFSYIATIIGDHMGCFLYQLPPTYHYTPSRLRAIVTQLQNEHKNVVEFRHESWWNDTVYRAFEEANIIFCSCSAPHMPDVLIKTADDIYIRFHGKNVWYRHDYSDDELNEWAKRIKQANAKQVWVYFNNDYDGYAIKNSKKLADLLKINL